MAAITSRQHCPTLGTKGFEESRIGFISRGDIGSGLDQAQAEVAGSLGGGGRQVAAVRVQANAQQ